MSDTSQRFLFIEFKSLSQIRMELLAQVSSKIFLFVGSDVTHIPIAIAMPLQALGSKLRWIHIPSSDPMALQLSMAFEIGRQDRKTEKKIAFAMLSENSFFSVLAEQLIATGRSCNLIGTVNSNYNPSSKEESEEIEQAPIPNGLSSAIGVQKEMPVRSLIHNEAIEDEDDEDEQGIENDLQIRIYRQLASDTVRQLIRSGNRPGRLDALREYISYNNQDLVHEEVIDRVLQTMIQHNEITIQNAEVSYYF